MAGLFTNNIVIWIVGLVAVITLINLVCLILLTKKIKRLLGGTQAKDIEGALSILRKEIDGLEKFRDDISKYIKSVEKRLKRSVQSVDILRFNPFKGTGDGGNQSFSMSMINEHGDGAVVSGLYSRERISVFSKPIKSFSSEFELSQEEKKVIENSQKKIRE